MDSARRALKVFRETVDGAVRTQIGPFGEHLPEEDARLISALVFALSGPVEQMATLVTECSAGAAADLVKGTASTVGPGAWTQRDERSAALRLVHLGSVTLRCSTNSAEALARALGAAWPHGRIMICMGEHEIDPGDTDWMHESVDPKPLTLQSCSVVVVSFFHGQWIALYRRIDEPDDTVERVSEVGGRFGKTVEQASEPF